MGRDKTKIKTDKIQANWKVINRLLLILVFFLGASWLIGVNDASIKTLALQEQKKKIFALKNEKADLELEVMSLSSYNHLSQRLPALDMVKVDKVQYLEALPAVAMKR